MRRLLLLLLLLSAPAEAQTPGCPRGARPEVAATLDYTEPRENYGYSVAQLTQQRMLDLSGQYIGGYTLGALNYAFQVTYEQRISPGSGLACVAPKKITYVLQYAPKVYIASDFLKMECQRGVTVMHEARHVQTALAAVRKFLPALRAAMTNYAAALDTSRPVPVGDIERRQTEIKNGLNAALRAPYEQMTAYEHAGQAAIDSAAGYRRDNALCPNHPVPPSVRAR